MNQLTVNNIFDTELYFHMTPEKRLKLLCPNIKIKLDEYTYPNHVFWFNNSNCIFIHYKTNNSFAVNEILIANIIESEFKLNKEQTGDVLLKIIKELLKIDSDLNLFREIWLFPTINTHFHGGSK